MSDKVIYSNGNGLTLEMQADSQKEIFTRLAGFQETFGESACGKCGKTEIRYVVRTVDDNDYYELRCLNRSCNARLSFGVNKNGKTLFPKRKDSDGKYISGNGWGIYNKETGKTE
jgi:hypothetical protein